PLLFMSDVIGRLFREFAITLAVAILLSLFISLTLTPMMCARLLKAEAPQHSQGLQHWLGKQLEALVAAYDASLQWVLRHQVLTLIIAAATLLFTAFLYMAVPKGFFPQQDTGLVQAISQGPQSASFTAMTRYQQEAVQALLQDDDVKAVTSFIGIDGTNATMNTGRLQIALSPVSERGNNVMEVIDRLSERLKNHPDLQVFFQPVQELTVDDQISRTQYQM